MKLQNQDLKNNLLSRLRKIEGQLRGVQVMVNEERDCKEILQQLSAVRSAVQGAMLYFVQEYATECLVNLDEADRGKREQFVADLMTLLGKSF